MATLLPQLIPVSLPKTKDVAVETIEFAESPTEDIESSIPSTINELISLRAQQSGNDRPIVAYPHEGTDYVDWTPKQLDALVERAAVHYSNIVPQRINSDDAVQVVGLLGNSDLDYLVAFLAISRLGHSALLLSTRITDEAYESLLSSTSATALIYQDTFAESVATISTRLPIVKTGTTFAASSSQKSVGTLKPALLDSNREANNVCFIIHSSGSTGLPKPIYQTHRAALYTYSQNFGLVGHITLPLYHNHGICCLFRAIHSRRKIYIYNARLPLASKHLLATLKEHSEIRILYGVPYALKLLSETEEGLKLLSRLDIVMFGGSACPKPIGDRLVDSGVNLVGHYGATEVGQLMTSFRNHREDKGWDWMRVPPHLKPYLSMELRGPNLYEACVNEGWGSKVATNRDDGSYATKDLFEPHPTIPDAWKYYARLDDTIALENGEKANPLLVEGVIRQDHNVAEAVVFGAGKPRLGAFIIPAETSTLSDNEIIDAVMPKIEEMNSSVPAYSQLSKDMVRVLERDTDYRRTDKGTVIRAAFYRDFSKQIDAAYVDKQSGTLVMARIELLSFLQKEMQKRVSLKQGVTLEEDADLFSLGVDSLQAIQVRSFILQHLKVDGEKLGRNFVFDFPTLGKMTDEIIRLQSGAPERQAVSVEEQISAMIEKYADFPQHVPVENPANGKYIVVTGVTGSLGAHVVANLVSQSSVHKVYCLVRAPSKASARTRVRDSLRERLAYHKLSLSARSKIVALPSNFGEANLGLEQSDYDAVSGSITHLIHLAWSVNFNKGLESFEGDCIAGAKNLMNLCLAAKRPEPASFNFCSSVSATAATPGNAVPEALPASLGYAQGMGYAQSKLVTEHLCNRASQQTGLKARVLRVGQIIGDTQHGVWNATEAIPLMLQTAKTIGALPELDETPYWLPVDTVAKACSEIACSGAESGVMNIVNDKNFHWTRDLLPLLREAGLQFETVPQQEWIRRLRASEADPVKNPPIKLVDFFASKYDNNKPRRSLAHATSRAQGYSPSLQNAGIIGSEIVGKIVSQLEKRWSAQEVEPAVIVLGGPCGSGKSTVARALSDALNLPMIEGDDMHSKVARQKMGSHIPLTDADRLSWLAHIRGAVMDRLRTTGALGVLVTCSALRSIYRQELRALQELAGVRTVFIMLETDSREELKTRLTERQGHYMAPAMVDAQVDLLESAGDDEIDVVPVNSRQAMDQVVGECQSIVTAVIEN